MRALQLLWDKALGALTNGVIVLCSGGVKALVDSATTSA